MQSWIRWISGAVLCHLASLGVGVGAAIAADKPLVAAVRPVTDTYFGTEVTDPYRYFENLKDPEVQSWMHAQADYTRAKLDAIPGRQALLARIHALSNADLVRNAFIRRGDRYFYMLRAPGAQQPKLYYRDGLKGEEHVLLDPDQMGKDSKTHFSLDYFTPSWNGKSIAYGVSTGGSEASVLHVLDVASGKPLGESIEGAHDSIVTWRADNASFFYLRYAKPAPGTPASMTEYNARTYLHYVGKSNDGQADPVVFGLGVSKNLAVPDGQGTYVETTPGAKYAIAFANHNLDSNPSTLYIAPLAKVLSAETPWRKWASVEDGIVQATLFGDKLYYLTNNKASRFKLMVTDAAKPDVQHATVVVPESKGVLTNFSFAKEGIYVHVREGGSSHLNLVSFDGKTTRTIPTPFEGAVYGPTTDPLQTGALFNLQGWVKAAKVYAYDPAANTSTDTGLRPESKIDASNFESSEVFATSYDGTRIPLSIIHKKGLVLDSSHPTILDGYGSYGATQEPNFSGVRLAWLERGGILAIAHIRGGGEYGEDWHRGGMMRTKLNTVLDFIACGEYLVDHHYTTSKLMAAEGVSAGGITVGGALTWRPDLFGVIIDQVGMSDALRSETEPNGPPNTSEFGSIANENGFHGLYGMSAYAHIRDGVAYPSVIFVTGANDPRVAPWHMLKMTARLRAATSSDKPILLRIDYDAGHGMGSNVSQREVERADLWSFALWQMGDAAFQPAGSK